MDEQIEALLDRIEALQREMQEHWAGMCNMLENGGDDWPIELDKYYVARDTLLEADKELASLLREKRAAA